MIKLNLIPGDIKKKKVVEKPKKDKEGPKKTPIQLDKFFKLGPQVIKIAYVALALLIGFNVLIGSLVVVKRVSLKKLDARWQPLQPKKYDLEKTNAARASFEKIANPIRDLVEGRCLWSKKLNLISDVMIQGIWLNKLFIEKQAKDVQRGEYTQTLVLEGCAISPSGEETALIGKFIKGLQEAKEFSSDFSEIKSGPLEKATLEITPIMNFKVYCTFKKN